MALNEAEISSLKMAELDLSAKADGTKWTVTEDGRLHVNDEIQSVIYHPSLNVVLVSSKTSVVRVVDVTSGAIIHTSDLSGE